MRGKWVWAAQRLICHRYCPPKSHSSGPPTHSQLLYGLFVAQSFIPPWKFLYPRYILSLGWLWPVTGWCRRAKAQPPRPGTTLKSHLIHRAPQTISWDSEATTLAGSPASLAPLQVYLLKMLLTKILLAALHLRVCFQETQAKTTPKFWLRYWKTEMMLTWFFDTRNSDSFTATYWSIVNPWINFHISCLHPVPFHWDFRKLSKKGECSLSHTSLVTSTLVPFLLIWNHMIQEKFK